MVRFFRRHRKRSRMKGKQRGGTQCIHLHVQLRQRDKHRHSSCWRKLLPGAVFTCAPRTAEIQAKEEQPWAGRDLGWGGQAWASGGGIRPGPQGCYSGGRQQEASALPYPFALASLSQPTCVLQHT